MEFTILGIGVLSWITFLPVLGMIAVLMMPKDARAAIRWTSLFVTILQVLLAIVIFAMGTIALLTVPRVLPGAA